MGNGRKEDMRRGSRRPGKRKKGVGGTEQREGDTAVRRGKRTRTVIASVL